ncbi:MAG: HAD-IA family hydrolase, partial [Candidatus Bathyarchaeota archaeon]|nr:HAD-IA family hydrolase [Candidatus Bathyarchaeota archaeon]
ILYRRFNGVLKKFGLPPVTPQQFCEKAGRPVSDILKKTVLKSRKIDDAFVKSFEREFVKIYVEEGFKNSRPFPSIYKALDFLRFQGIKTAIVTATPRVFLENELNRFNLKRYFDVIIAREDVKNFKPAPDAFLQATTLLKVKPYECVIVGDSPLDIKAGKKAKIKTIAVSTGLCSKERLQKEKPVLVVDDVSELLEIIQKM